MTTAHRTTYMTDRAGPLPFCPGCGHTPLLKALDRALVRLQPAPEKAVIVTDIGCIGLACRYFVTSAFHGLHGRAITYACGMKLARPELMVIALMGDGGCGIGGTHLLNVARRNIGIKLIVANNFNYGMTGGQHSVTTPVGGVTSTTPRGNVEVAMDLCATAAAAGASWVYRATAFDRDLPEVIVKAIEQPGFAMLDVWELCAAYYMPRNRLRKKELFQLLDTMGCAVGLQVENQRPEYSALHRKAQGERDAVPGRRASIAQKYRSNLERQTGIVIAGSAGQKVRSAATLLAEGAMFAGLWATQKDDYPITVQTGHSISEIIVSPERIDYTGIDDPDYLLVTSEDGLRSTRPQIEQLSEGCTLYAEQSLDLPETRARVRRLPLAQAGKSVGRLSLATIALGALLEDTAMFPLEAAADAIRMSSDPGIAELNLRGLRAGADLVRGPGQG